MTRQIKGACHQVSLQLSRNIFLSPHVTIYGQAWKQVQLSHLTDLMSISEMSLSLGWKDWGDGLLHQYKDLTLDPRDKSQPQ